MKKTTFKFFRYVMKSTTGCYSRRIFSIISNLRLNIISNPYRNSISSKSWIIKSFIMISLLKCTISYCKRIIKKIIKNSDHKPSSNLARIYSLHKPDLTISSTPNSIISTEFAINLRILMKSTIPFFSFSLVRSV